MWVPEKALRRSYQIAIEIIDDGQSELAEMLTKKAPASCSTEDSWRELLLSVGFSQHQVEEEVALVGGSAWSICHATEAATILLQIAIMRARAGIEFCSVLELVNSHVDSEGLFRSALTKVGYTQQLAIDRTVALVRDLAEGRREREIRERFVVRAADGSELANSYSWEEAKKVSAKRREEGEKGVRAVRIVTKCTRRTERAT